MGVLEKLQIEEKDAQIGEMKEEKTDFPLGIYDEIPVPEFRAVIHQVIKWNNLAIGVEYRPGDIRFKGKGFERKLRCGYGHIRNYVGADGEALDCYLDKRFFKEDDTPSNLIFEINQLSPEDGDFDEHKYMIGWDNQVDAKVAYLTEMTEAHFGGIEEVALKDLEQYRKKSANFEEPETVKIEGKVLSDKEYAKLAEIEEDDIQLALNNWKKVAPEAFANLLEAQHVELNQQFTYSELEFSKKTKNCIKGYSCGGTCISTNKQCRNPLDGQAKNFVDFLKLVNQKLKKEVEDLQRENQLLRDKAKNIEKNDDTRKQTNKYDYEKLEELFRKGYLEERRQQELEGVVAIKKEEMRLRLEDMGVTDDEFEVIYGKLKKDGKIFSVVEKDDELIQLNFEESFTATN